MPVESKFAGRDFKTDSANILNTPVIGTQLLREARAQGVFEQMTVEVQPANDGYITANVNVGATAAVKRVTIPEAAGSREFRAAYMLDASGRETFGQNVPTLGEKAGFLYSNIEIGLRVTPQFAEHSEMQKRDGQNTLKLAGGSAAIAQSQVKTFAGRQINADHYAGLLRGGDDVTLSLDEGALGKDIGGVNNGDAAGNGTTTYVGSQALHENFVMFDGTATGGVQALRLTSSTAASRTAHETSVATYLRAQQALTDAGQIAKNTLTRDSIQGLKFWASKWNIRKLMGKDHDYILVMDEDVAESLMGSLEGDEKATLVAILKMLANGTGTKKDMLDYRVDNLIIDGVLIVPDRTLNGWRPAALDASPIGAEIVYAGASAAQSAYWAANKHTAYETNTNNVGISFLLGDTALLHATDGSMEMMDEEGPFKTGRSWAGREWRTLRRAIWTGKDAANAGKLRNEGSIQLFSRISPNLGAL